jgi:hypothetical protein
MDVVIGVTLADARRWRADHIADAPHLALAMLVSAYAYGPARLDGSPVHRIYGTPDAYRGRYYRRTLDTARRNQAKAGNATEPGDGTRATRRAH